mgnify:CR=1 FL=1
MSLVKIPNTNLVREIESKALINRDSGELQSYLSRRKLLESQRDELNTVKYEMNNLKNDIVEIKQLMLQLLDKGSNG